MRRLILASVLLLSACQPWSSEEDSTGDDRPEVPDPTVTLENREAWDNYVPEVLAQLPLPRYSPKAEALFGDILDHPWIARQPDVLTLTRVMVDDIRLLELAHQQLTKQREEMGVDTPTLAEETSIIINSLDLLQGPLQMLGLSFPTPLYRVLNIPASSAAFQAAPIPFQVHKRVHLFTTESGRPTFVDLRVFPLNHIKEVDQQDRAVLAIVAWHLNTLIGGEPIYTRYASPDCVAFIGSGDHDISHLNVSHGFATKDRTVFAAFLQQAQRLYVLYAEGPKAEMEGQLDGLLAMLGRRLVKVPDSTGHTSSDVK